MDKIKSAVFLSLILLLPGGLLFGADSLSVSMQQTLLQIEQAGPPVRIDNRILFTYQPAGRARLVGARFEYEDFRRLHAYARNPHGVYLLLLALDDLPRGLREIRYRVVEDGLWMADPFNPSRVADTLGTEFSIVFLGDPLPGRVENPLIGERGSVKLQLKEMPGRRVTLSGTFNSWDPFLYPLAEEEPGQYRIVLRLPPGTYYYYFWVDGERRLDPFNPLRSYDNEGRPVSRLVVPEEPRLSGPDPPPRSIAAGAHRDL